MPALTVGLTVGVVKESAPEENRVALVPEVLSRLTAAGLTVLVESGAGAKAWFSDNAYVQAGATVVPAEELIERADVLVCVRPPDPQRLARLRPGQVVVGLLTPFADPALVSASLRGQLTTVSLDLLPRTLSRAQPMDALSSQANIAGYKAVLVAADAYGRYFPMLMTAAGTAKPAQVLVLGAGVAGLSAIGTARRLGAIVTGYDIRPETREEVRSLGAKFLELDDTKLEGSGVGGYARALTDAERDAQQQALQERIAGFDVVITTAAVPGRTPPVLVTAAALKQMRPGSVVVDIAAGPLGGNVELCEPDRTIVVADGVTIIGAGNLASAMAAGASTAYSRNISAMVTHLVRDGALAIDTSDEILAAVVVTHGGAVINPTLAASLPAPQRDGGTA
jgi:NAD(P) transhydrogenase subunit alpha